jgi:hypothetical protein
MTTTSPPASPLAAQYEDRVAQAIEQEDAHREETVARAQRLITAGDEAGFCGDLRRAIHSSGIRLEQIAEAAKLHVFALCDFLEGTGELTSSQIAAIVQLRGLQLVRTISRESPRKPPTAG